MEDVEKKRKLAELEEKKKALFSKFQVMNISELDLMMEQDGICSFRVKKIPVEKRDFYLIKEVSAKL